MAPFLRNKLYEISKICAFFTACPFGAHSIHLITCLILLLMLFALYCPDV
jgi:hypothetical protein